MSPSLKDQLRCFLCRKINLTDIPFKNVEDSLCPSSKKSVKGVLYHLARTARFELHIDPSECLCHQCFNHIVDYDTTLVNLIQQQKSLAKLVEMAVTEFDSDIEAECLEEMSHMKELNDENFCDDVHVSDREIAGTIFEAMGGKRIQKQKSVNGARKRAFENQSDDEYSRGESSNEIIQCTLCAMRFRNRILLQKHVVNVHKKVSCTMCSFSHRNEDYVMLHMNVHEGKSENQCRYCNKEFTTKSSTIRHMEVHLNTKKYQCDKCGLCFSQTTMLYTHKLQHEAEENPLRCEICNQIFKTKRTFRHHMVTHRADRPRHSCEYCCKTFTERYTLKVHKRAHHDVEEQTEQSTANRTQGNKKGQQYSGDGTEQSSGLQQKTTANAVNSLVRGPKCSCIICDQQFTNKDNLDKHMEKEHDVILKSLNISNFDDVSRKQCRIDMWSNV